MPKKIKLVDVVNLNSKASCLSASRWMKALEGGEESELCSMLRSYIDSNAKVSLGIIGSTLADIVKFNPESIQLIADHPSVFELIYRPYVHSLSIFWSDKIFKTDVEKGQTVINKYFKNIYPAYLPPEFVLRNSQLVRLNASNISTTFIHPNRVKSDLKAKLPKTPFTIQTIQQQEIKCIPFHDQFDKYYLNTIQMMEHAEPFQHSGDLIFGWRDGESPLFLPNSVERESYFIEQSSKQFDRIFLSEIPELDYADKVTSYPQNSLLPWFSNFRLLWYINELKLIEATQHELSPLKYGLFYLLLNSDVLSSTEKDDIKIRLNSLTEPGNIKRYTIRRQSRNLEAEEILYLIENCNDEEINQYLSSTTNDFIKFIHAELNEFLELK